MTLIKHYNLTLNPPFSQNILTICSKIVLDFQKIPNEELQLKQFTTGLTNLLYRISSKNLSVLCRIYGQGTDKLLDRETELKILDDLAQKGIGPKIFGSFTNGYIYEYFEGFAITEEDLHSEKYTKSIASALSHWHKQDVKSQKSPQIWKFLDKWISMIPDEFEDKKKTEKIEKMLGNLKVSNLREEIQFLKEKFTQQNFELVFSHNDTLSQNFIFNESDSSIKMIDYEYAGYNYQAFDIGNHWVEWAGPNQTLKYPNEQQKENFISNYVDTFYGSHLDHLKKKELLNQSNKCMALSLFMWGLWGIYQCHFSDVDADFFEYSEGRWKNYWKFKNLYLK